MSGEGTQPSSASKGNWRRGKETLMKTVLIFVLLAPVLPIALQAHAAVDSFQDATQRGDPRKGIELFTGLIKDMPDRIELYLLRATCYQQVKEYNKALADYNKAIELDASQPGFFVGRGKVYEEKGQFEQALADFSKALELDADNAAAHLGKGRTFGMQKNYEKAFEEFSKAIDIDPKEPSAYAFRGHLFVQKKNFDKALTDFSKAVELAPDISNAYVARGIGYL
jgi:eukaryotic-like serine/threonine-protein kinase